MRSQRLIQCLTVLFLLVTLSGCAAKRAYTQGEKAMRRHNFDQAVLQYSKAVAMQPGNNRFTVALARAKVKAANVHFAKGQRYADAGQLELAIAEYQQVLLLHPGHQYASNELQRAARELQARQAGDSELEVIKEQARKLELGPPRLDPRANIPIGLDFKDQPLGKIFEAISKASGINFIYDEKTDLDKPLDLELGNVSLEKALDIIMLQTKTFYKPIDNYTLLIAPDTRQKRQEYEDQVIRTFFLSNADTKQVVTLLRSLLQSRQIAENDDLNTVTIKDTPDKVAIAERIIESNDKSKGEVLIDTELLEVNRTVTQTLGLDLTSKVLSLTFRGGDEAVPLNDLDSLKQTGNWTVGVVPSVLLNFLKSDSDSRLLAKPSLRVSEGEQAEILIGSRIPIPTTSFNTSQTVGGNIVPITSFTYQNVGITVQIEPRVHHNKEVTLRVQVEFSQVTGFVSQAGAQQQPIIGTRQIQTVIRLRDGETNMLAGLIQRSTQDTLSGIPGVSDIPGLRRVFGSTNLQEEDTDIILTLTPRILRIPDFTREDLATLWVGSEENMQLRGPARDQYGRSPFAPAQSVTIPESPIIPNLNGDAGVRSDDPRRGGEADLDPDTETGADRGTDTSGDDEPEAEPDAEPANGPAIVRGLTPQTLYAVGDTFDVVVEVVNAQNVGSIPFKLRYNPATVQFVGHAEGAFLAQDGNQTFVTASAIPTNRQVVVGASRLGGPGIAGSGQVITLSFQAIAPGSAGFAFDQHSVMSPRNAHLPSQFVPPIVQVK